MVPLIQVKNLYKSFHGKQILKNLNLEIYDGEIFVILGQSGSGKTILLKHFMGFIKPDSGSVSIDGDEMSQLEGRKLYERLKNIGMIFQMGALFDSMTVGENISFYLNEHRIKGGKKIRKSDIAGLVKEALKKVGLEDTEDLYPSSLSGGMKKRASIARSVVFEPDYLFYDEPTTGLDPLTAQTVAELIVKQQEQLKATTVVVSHDIVTTLYIADRIALIEDGEISIVAPPEEFMNHNHPSINHLNAMIGRNYNLIRNRRS